MVYNYKYKMEWVGMKNADASEFYYRLEFYKKESSEVTYDVITLQASNSPFVLSYRAKSNYVFEPFRASSAEINIILNDSSSVSPNEFFIDVNNDTFKVVFKLIDVTGATETELWKGFLINNDIQYEWQETYPLRLNASDNIGLLKDYKYSDPSEYKMYESADLYTNISIKDFVIRGLNYIGLDLDVKFAFNFYVEALAKNETNIFISEYSAIDWSKKSPYDVYRLIGDLMTSLGCILYQDNRDASWTILNINEVACSTNNEVPYRKYDKDGVEISTGNYNISGSINVNSDVIWSDKNQVVTLRERFDKVELKYPYIKKNLIQNYSFFKDVVSSTDLNYWNNQGGFLADVETNLLPYAPYVLQVTNREDKLFPVDGTKYCYNLIDFNYYRVNNAVYDKETAIVINFDYMFPEGDIGDGFNVSFYSYRPSDGNYLTFDGAGDWYTNSSADRTRNNPVAIDAYFGTEVGDWNNFNAVSKFTSYQWYSELDQFYIYIRGIRTDAGETPIVNMTNFIINAVPVNLTRVSKFVYIASQKYNQSQTIPTYQLNTKTIEAKYHSGNIGSYSSMFYDDCLMVLYNDGFNDFIDSSVYWSKNWQVHNESTYKPLQSLTASSILSFYRQVGRIFNGNVYAEQTPNVANYLAFPMYLEVSQTFDEQKISALETAFEFRVVADGGVCETSLCGSDFLSEFYQPNSKFLMHEASFDYATNKTLVNIQEDFTSTDESIFFVGLGQNETTTTSNIGEPGSNSNNTQTSITSG